MARAFSVDHVQELPEDIGPLVEESISEGHQFLARLCTDWRSGENSFARASEGFFTARDQGLLVGVCGLNTDPYAGDPAIGRLRRLYVTRGARRHGVGRALVAAAVAHGRVHYQRVRVRTLSAEAHRFYQALGFSQISTSPEATHELALPRLPAA